MTIQDPMSDCLPGCFVNCNLPRNLAAIFLPFSDIIPFFYLAYISLVSSIMQLNQGQSTGPAGVDVDVMPVWRQGITGKGVVVSILDDGVDHTHPDLRDNFVS